jgi:hypothetical protein
VTVPENGDPSVTSSNKETGVPDVDLAALGSDAELLAATLDVYRELDLAEQLQRLINHAVAWSGASCGFALGPGEAC